MTDPFARRHAAPRAGLVPIGNRRYAAGMIALALTIGATMLLTVGAIAHASTPHQPGTVQFYRGPIGAGQLPVIRYTSQEPLCRASQAGKLGMVTGDRTPFLVRCKRDGDVWVWDADLR